MSSITPELIGLETVSVVATSSTDELRKAAWLGLGLGVGLALTLALSLSLTLPLPLPLSLTLPLP